MKAILLAAGRGKRMGNYTDDGPKCFLKIDGKELLHYQLHALRSANINDIAIVRGYKPHLFTEKVTYFDNVQWSTTGISFSLACATEWLSSTSCIISYTDIIYPSSIVESLAASSEDIAVAYDPNWAELWNKRFENPLTDAESFKITTESRIIEIGKKSPDPDSIEGQYMGLFKLTVRGWQIFVDALKDFPDHIRQTIDITSVLQNIIQKGHPVYGVPLHGYWCEIDSPSDMEIAAEIRNKIGD